MPQRHRILLVEDDTRRVERFRAWLPSEVILVEARSAGQAMGFLTRLQPGELSGILLDHDLGQRAMTDTDARLSGSHLVDLIIRHVERDVPVFIHSTNAPGAESMARPLKAAGFSVASMPMHALTREQFGDWLGEVLDCE